MEIIWHGHSCFELVSGGFSLVLDPYCHRELCGYPSWTLRLMRCCAATAITATAGPRP